MDTPYKFPFGEPVRRLIQQEHSAKRIFVLGDFPNPVYARWIGPDGETRIDALAVASEPYLFWRGEDIEPILSRIHITPRVGQLLPAIAKLNGPSGMALDEQFLHPLGFERADAWLCCLVPYSCIDAEQMEGIAREYIPRMKRHRLPQVTVPPVPRELTDEARRQEIVAELEESGATAIMLLGDEPVRWFLNSFDPRWKSLADFGQDRSAYGQVHEVTINERDYHLLPLTHPRQVARLVRHSAKWHELHTYWAEHAAHIVLGKVPAPVLEELQ